MISRIYCFGSLNVANDLHLCWWTAQMQKVIQENVPKTQGWREKEAWRSSNFVKKCGELGTHTLLLSPQETAKVAEPPDDGRKTETQWNMCWPLLQVNEAVIIVAAAAVERDDANAIVTMLLPPSCSNSLPCTRALSLSLSLSLSPIKPRMADERNESKAKEDNNTRTQYLNGKFQNSK